MIVDKKWYVVLEDVQGGTKTVVSRHYFRWSARESAMWWGGPGTFDNPSVIVRVKKKDS